MIGPKILSSLAVGGVAAPQELGRHTRGEDVMLQMGGDFGFEDANAWFKNLDSLMAAVNKEGRVNVSGARTHHWGQDAFCLVS